MRKYVQNIDRLFAGQTANALVLSQVDEDFPVLIPALKEDEDSSIGQWMRGIQNDNHPDFIPLDWAYEVRFVADDGKGHADRISLTRTYLQGMDENILISSAGEMVIQFPYDSLEDSLRSVYQPEHIHTDTTVLDLLNTYVVEFNLSLQQRFKDKAHEELYMMDDTRILKPDERTLDLDKTYMHTLNGKVKDEASANLSQLNVLFPWRKTTSKSIYASQLKPRPASDMDDLLERAARGITLQGRTSYLKCLQAVAQAGNQLYMLSPQVDVSSYIYANSQVILNGFDVEDDSRMNPLPNSLTLFQPSDFSQQKHAVSEFVKWYENHNHRMVVRQNATYGTNVSVLKCLGSGSYELELATNGPSDVVVSGEAISLDDDTFRSIRAETTQIGRYLSRGVFSIGESDKDIDGIRFNLLNGFITGEDRVVKMTIPADKDFNELFLRFSWTANNSMSDQVEFFASISGEGVEEVVIDDKVAGGGQKDGEIELPLHNTILEDREVELTVRIHYAVDYNRRQSEKEYREWLKETYIMISDIRVENDVVPDSDDLTFGSYINEDGIDEAEHNRRLMQFWQVSRYKNDVSYQSVVESSIKNTTTAGIRNLNNYSSGDVYGDMFLTKSMLKPTYDMDIEAAWFNEKEGKWAHEGDENAKPVLRFSGRNYINLLQCSNQLTLVYGQATTIVGEDEYGRTYGKPIPWHDWTDSSTSSFLVAVVWDSQGGDDQGVWLVKRGSRLKDAGKALPTPARQGYSFDGWWTSPGEEDSGMTTRTARASEKDGWQPAAKVDENTYILDSVTFYARWQVQSSQSRLVKMESRDISEDDDDDLLESEGMSHTIADGQDGRYAELKYQMVETVRNINRFESSIKHKSNVFSVVVENSNLAEDKSVDRDEDTPESRLENYKEQLRNSVTQFVRNACKDIVPVHTQLFDVQFT